MALGFLGGAAGGAVLAGPRRILAKPILQARGNLARRPVEVFTAGGVLVLASDGLFEAADARGEAYGFDRPAAVVRAVSRRPAEAILEALLADWRRHLGDEEPADDTTVLVIKRR
jgi:serine phosphatase RsbU (regulator of sigma subunit)